ncbi:hypothetical protein [Paenibacillus tyrfis]|uniref:Uncharacterized protein n=1 Tax=Paenibacillus tyrfis TaxID=1501230 RepID=A0A081NU60_9BACL|nr:hypothetical protein [Paenibacillus tyrfis]KEQ21983.1 hypothetical protein ET33_28695 [Paenibacillus tyrfis]
MRLVTTMMTTEELSDSDISKATNILLSRFKNKFEIYKYNYDGRKYREVDIDLFDVVFSKEKIYDEIDNLISAYEEIMNTIPIQIDFIAGNDDTDSAVIKYEQDIQDIKDFGLFVTKRTIPNIQPYYSSQICNAYVNLTHVSFGIYY